MFDLDIGDHDVASNIPRIRVSLRLSGDALDPEFLTQQLGVAPTIAARRGEDIPAEEGGGTHDTGVWIYRLDVPPGTDLGEVIDLLLASFPEDALLWEELTSAFAADVSCGVFLQDRDQSTVIDATVLQRLARLGLSLGLDFHAPLGVERDGDGT